jgi:hypothetical protein
VCSSDLTAPMDIVHTYVLGPIHEESVDGYRYAVGFVDSFNRTPLFT